MMAGTMKAITLRAFGGPEALELKSVARPVRTAEEVLIRVKAFGINRVETFVRQGAFGPVSFPRILGIEAVGEVIEAPKGTFAIGGKVATATGGMGHTRDGGYAEYLAVPASQVQALDTSLDWEILAGLPEIMQTAWGALHLGVEIEEGQTLLIRGGSTAVGLGAIGIAKAAGLEVIATTRKIDRSELLHRHGASAVVVDTGQIASQVRQLAPEGVDGVIELVGASTMLDSMRATRLGGTVCVVGMLGPKTALENFRPLMDPPSRVKLVAYRGGVEEFMATPLQAIARDIEAGRIVFELGRTFSMDRTADAHRLMEVDAAGGKIVVTV